MQKEFIRLINQSFEEDLSNIGDITTSLLTSEENKKLNFQIIAKEDLIICGIEVIKLALKEVTNKYPDTIKITQINVCNEYQDGSFIKKGELISSGSASMKAILIAERTILNLIQHLSGIATLTYEYSSLLKRKNSKIKILDTRKTIPGLRKVQKYAVKIGRGQNHRFGLYDQILIKDNHIEALNNVSNILKRIKQKNNVIEVECENLSQVKECLKFDIVDIIMLDNMDVTTIKDAIKIIDKKFKIEVSGNMNLEKISQISSLDIDFISIGQLTHSVRSSDISLETSL